MDTYGTEFNLADVVALLLILISVLAGFKQGFISGLLDLVGVVAGVYLSFKGYPSVGAVAAGLLSWPQGISNLIAFLGLFVASQVLLSLAFGWLLREVRRVLRLFPTLRLADALAGTLPGFVKGIVAVMLLILILGLFPVFPEAQGEIKRSYSGYRLISLFSETAPRFEAMLGSGSDETLTFLTRPESGTSIRLNLPIPTRLSLDLDSEQRMLTLVNEERAKAGLLPLVMDEKLRRAARGHSEEMFELSYFAHESPVAGSPADRMREEGAAFIMAAENIAYAPNVEMAHSGLMNSPSHRKSILTPGFRRIGIGVIDGGLKGKMFTQNFSD